MKALSPGSVRIAAAAEFGQAMDAAMRRKGVGKGSLSKAAKVGNGALSMYRRGSNLPTRATAQRIAYALGTPSLLTIVEEARRGSCQVCDAVVWQEHGRPTLYCSAPCRNIGRALGYTKRLQGTVMERDALQGALTAHRDAVSAFCGMCPDNEDGYCGNDTCPLLKVTTAVVRRPSVKEADRVVKPDPWAPEHRAARSNGNRRAWQDPARRKRQAERSRAMHAAMSDEEREAWRQSVSAGRRRAAA